MTERPCSQSDGQLVLPPIELKERLHHFPTQRTNVASADLRTRHRMLGNSWHVGIAQFILFFILSSCRATAVILADNTIPNRPKQSSIQLMFSLAQGEEHAMGPIPRRFDPMRKAPAVDQWEHWRLAKSLCHPLLQQPVLEPGAAQVLHKLNNMGDIDRLRKEVIEDLTQMIDDWVITPNVGWTPDPLTSRRCINLETDHILRFRCFWNYFPNVAIQQWRTSHRIYPLDSTM